MDDDDNSMHAEDHNVENETTGVAEAAGVPNNNNMHEGEDNETAGVPKAAAMPETPEPDSENDGNDHINNVAVEMKAKY